MTKQYKIIFIAIIFIAFILRIYGINWDQGHNLHPDERAIIMYTLGLSFPHSLLEFLSVNSPLNPHFFAYGNFPLYLLKASSTMASWFDVSFSYYERIALVGRFLSALADIGTLFILFLISRRLFSHLVGLFSIAIYALSVFPIQTSHFYAVDTLLTFFMSLTLYYILLLTKKMNRKTAIFAGISFGLALATKASAVVLVVPFTIWIGIYLYQHYGISKKKKSSVSLKNFITVCTCIFISTLFIFAFTQPYAIIDYQAFISQTIAQSHMTKDVFTFPYTMQYYGKTPYIYELKNIFLWGLGPVITMLSFFGIFIFFKISKKSQKECYPLLIIGGFIISYFLIVGDFAVGWMRYMLPLYPFFALFAGLTLVSILKRIYSKKRLYYFVSCLLAIGICIWPMSFIQIYGSAHSRVIATNWILSTIPQGSTIATEHWDDSLPLTSGGEYNYVEIPMYEPDTKEKWNTIQARLSQADYLILSSNRLYTPLQKLTDCNKLPEGRCYTKSAEFYKNLFSGGTNFKKIADFTDYPTIPFLNIPINDQSADESFTVYDHPKVMIFKKTRNI